MFHCGNCIGGNFTEGTPGKNPGRKRGSIELSLLGETVSPAQRVRYEHPVLGEGAPSIQGRRSPPCPVLARQHYVETRI